MISEEGAAKLLDFGLAKLLDTSAEGAAAASPGDPGLRAFARTHAGTRVGTPLYMAPEIWRGEAATKRADVYSLGVVLYELCIGRVPRTQIPRDASPEETEIGRDAEARGLEIDAELAAIIDRCLRHDPGARFPSADLLREPLESAAPAPHGAQIPPGSPYRGLQSIDAEHAALFFGRGAEVRAVLDRLRGPRFVLIAADSGVGKASLCRAGVLPAVERGLIADGHHYGVIRLVLGAHPLQALASALAGLSAQEEPVVLIRLREDPVGMARALRSSQDAQRTLLFIDQLEEIFILADPEEMADTAECLAELLLHGGDLRLLATLRSDFLTRMAALPALGDEVAQALYLLRPLSSEGVHEAIVGPARSKGFRFETEEMIRKLTTATARAPGGLPLLAFTLDALWELRDKSQRVIPESALEQLGGVTGALANHADTVLLRMTPAQRLHARSIFQSLVSAEGTRLQRSEEALLRRASGDRDAAQALRLLVRSRLLIARTDEQGRRQRLRVAHEALITGWQTLRSWLIHDADRRALIDRLAAAAREWERMGRTAEGLWGTRQLAEIADLQAPELAPSDAQFLAMSRRRAARNRALRVLAGISVPAVLGISYAGVWIEQRQERNARVAQQLTEARRALTSAETEFQALERSRTRALPLYTQGQRVSGDAAWQQALAHAEQADEHFAQAGQALEKALMIDAARPDVRSLLADVLYQQVLIAERTYQSRPRAQLLQRLAIHDKGSGRLARLRAPGLVTVRSEPRGTAVLEAYGSDPARRLRVLQPGAPTPLELRSLLPGSYRLTVSAPGRAAVRYPFVVERGETLQLDIRLPETAAVPAGFVYVPAGRFLSGSAAEDTQRKRWFSTAPLHQASIGAFFIARYETTFREWLEFLRAQPVAERARYLLQTGTPHGAQGLRQRADGRFDLTLKPSSVAYTAAEGEKIVYPGRSRRREQNWLRFPVTGVTAAQATAYAAWLGSSGRVPGARLCTDFEWELAARGADDREYPHADRMDPDDAKFDETYNETYNKEPRSFGPDEVGSHPASRSPFDVEDLIGNAFEWGTSPMAAHGFAIRGGSYYYGHLTGRIPNRTEPELSMQNPTQGLRICTDAAVP